MRDAANKLGPIDTHRALPPTITGGHAPFSSARRTFTETDPSWVIKPTSTKCRDLKLCRVFSVQSGIKQEIKRKKRPSWRGPVG